MNSPATVLHGRDDRALCFAAHQLILKEADALDSQRWTDWLALYAEDAIFWMPAWLDEHQITFDVENQMSCIYHDSRSELSDRVTRIMSNNSATTMPLPRTVHLVGFPLITGFEDDVLTVRSSATVHIYDPRTMDHDVTVSRYEYELRCSGDDWRIKQKKIIMINDCMPSVIDFYSI